MHHRTQQEINATFQVVSRHLPDPPNCCQDSLTSKRTRKVCKKSGGTGWAGSVWRQLGRSRLDSTGCITVLSLIRRGMSQKHARNETRCVTESAGNGRCRGRGRTCTLMHTDEVCSDSAPPHNSLPTMLAQQRAVLVQLGWRDCWLAVHTCV